MNVGWAGLCGGARHACWLWNEEQTPSQICDAAADRKMAPVALMERQRFCGPGLCARAGLEPADQTDGRGVGGINAGLPLQLRVPGTPRRSGCAAAALRPREPARRAPPLLRRKAGTRQRGVKGI